MQWKFCGRKYSGQEERGSELPAESSFGEGNLIEQVPIIFREQVALYHAMQLERGFPTMYDEDAGLTEPDASASTNPNPM